ncbi:hypothetical protein D3C71_1046010 [compost metagenome]
MVVGPYVVERPVLAKPKQHEAKVKKKSSASRQTPLPVTAETSPYDAKKINPNLAPTAKSLVKNLHQSLKQRLKIK